ncbi:MAG: isoprenylcysteine carboxylmethyltransferase family protein [Natronohydrobacter sp.]|nr:isoprenylcysteine carboxylmethyltransferase family protein [Natronohydrobacter sp.]
MRHFDYPPVWLIAALGLVWAETLVVPGLVAYAGVQIFGTGLVAVALVLIALAAWSFLRARSTIIPHQTPQRLINSGIFALTRNPIYLADVLLLVGLSLRWGALSGLVLAPVLLWVLQHRFILAEEARIRAAFGAQAEGYFSRTRRWI